MIISHKYKFIFVRTEKTAGTSIEAFLSEHCSTDDIVANIADSKVEDCSRNWRGYFNPLPDYFENPSRGLRCHLFRALIKKRKYYTHMPASLIKRRLSSEIWDSYFSFAVTRNPWDMVLSHFHFTNGGRDKKWDSFGEYLARCNFPKASSLYTNRQGEIIVNRIVRYETLMNDLGRVFDQLGIPFDGDLKFRAKSHYRKDRTPYQNVYTPWQRSYVAKSFEKEIKLHDYTF